MIRLATTASLVLRCRREDGGMTIFGLYIFLGMAILAGIGVDFSNLIAHRTHLQVAADVAAHAAIVTRQNDTESAGKLKAIELATGTMPYSRHGNTLAPEDIHFGTWNRTTRVFTPDSTSKAAVLVETSNLQAKSNPVASFLLHLVGFSRFDVRTQSVFETYERNCLREGFVAENVVDIRSNNGFYKDFCIHSNGHVEMQNHNFFEDGTRVTMPDKDDLVIPGSGMTQNPGLDKALGEDEFNLDIVDDLPDIFDDLYNLNGTSEHWPSYVTNTAVRDTISSGGTYDDSDFTDGRVTWVNCSGNESLTIAKDTVLTNVAIITDCAVNFKSGVALEDSMIFTTDSSANSFKGPQGIRLGKDDSCATGGGAQLLTMGGTHFASGLQMYGGQIIGAGTIEFAAQADGLEGASIIAGDEISGTSLMNMGLCEGSGLEDHFTTTYFRLAG